MIGQLRGILIEKEPPSLLLDVGGVGYSVLAPLSTFFTLPELGQEATLRIHMVVREDAQLLYGFATRDEKVLFEHLIKVSGIGPKIALTILSGLSPQEFGQMMQLGEIQPLQRLPGIGAKTAQRLFVEMRDKWAKLQGGMTTTGGSNNTTLGDPNRQMAEDALVSLGYKPQEAQKALSQLGEERYSVEEMIKRALQGLAKI